MSYNFVFIISGLKLGTEYEITVKAINRLGHGLFQETPLRARTSGDLLTYFIRYSLNQSLKYLEIYKYIMLAYIHLLVIHKAKCMDVFASAVALIFLISAVTFFASYVLLIQSYEYFNIRVERFHRNTK